VYAYNNSIRYIDPDGMQNADVVNAFVDKVNELWNSLGDNGAASVSFNSESTAFSWFENEDNSEAGMKVFAIRAVFGSIIVPTDKELIDKFIQIWNGGKGIDLSIAKLSRIINVENSEIVKNDLKELSKTTFGALLIASIELGDQNILVTQGNFLEQPKFGENYQPGQTSPANGFVNLKYDSGYQGELEKGVKANGVATLGHELFHAYDIITGRSKTGLKNLLIPHSAKSVGFSKAVTEKSAELFGGNRVRIYMEVRAVLFENLIRYELGKLPYRTGYAPTPPQMFKGIYLEQHEILTKRTNNLFAQF
jgi:hypothetical protein